ncbi:MAG: oligosaccharide flippase family protein [Candidatus Eisenbacteria bacterium]|uniref:Oligosaccharide flippase family protein n=1 Tax=Eiseniibacteriota bacterium TaxID=2212470 RepID=A0A7Y2H3U9_UNCEI|nr:oligosaccharide flippase family protein [Candidatus Eisenbacteria bacterium]
MKRRLFLNSSTGSLLLVIQVAVAFILSPVLVRVLGDAGYGIWEVVLSIFGYLAALDLGVGPAVVRYVSKASASKDRNEINRILSSAMFLMILAGLVSALVMVVLGVRFNFSPQEYSQLVSQWRPLCFVMALNIFVIFVGVTFGAHQFGLQRHSLANLFRIISIVGQGFAYYWVLTQTDGPYLVYLAWVLTLSNLFYFAALGFASFFGSDRCTILPSLVSKSHIKQLFLYGLSSVLLMISDRIQKSTPLIIAPILGPQMIVFFVLPSRLMQYAIQFSNSASLPVTPYFSFLEGQNQGLESTHRSWFALSRVLQFVLIAMGVGLVSLGEPFIARWIGPEYATTGRWVIRILGATLFIEAFAPVASQLLLGRGKHQTQARWTLVLSLVGLVLMILGGLGWGLVGISLAYALMRLSIQSTWCGLALREVGIGVAQHLQQTLLRFALPAGVTLLVVFWVRTQSYPASYPAILAQAALAVGLFSVLSSLLAVSGSERKAVFSWFGSRLSGKVKK